MTEIKPHQQDIGGQLFPYPVLVSFLSGFSGKSCPVSVCCPDSVWLDSVSCQDSVRTFRKMLSGIFLVSILSAVEILSGFFGKRLSAARLSGFSSKIVCPGSVRRTVSGLDSVRILAKKALRCLSVRPDKDETELSGLSLSLSADV